MIQTPSLDIAETNLVEEWKSVNNSFALCQYSSSTVHRPLIDSLNSGWSNMTKY